MEMETFNLITDWKERVNVLQRSSYAKADKYDKYHYVVGSMAVIFSAVASATLFSSLLEPWVKWTFGVGSVFASIILASQTFFTHSRKSEKYRFIILQLVDIRRDIELYEEFVPEEGVERNQRNQQIEKRIADIEEKSADTDEVDTSPKWAWGLLGIVSAILVIVLIPAGLNWARNFFSVEEVGNNTVRDHIQQGAITWEFDPTDPLVEERIIFINTWINEMTTEKAVTLIHYLNQEDPETPITIYLSSTGGYTKDGIAIVNAIQASEAPVDTIAIGDCFSACSMILMSGTGERLAASTSRIAIHTHEYAATVDPYAESSVRYQREVDFYETYSNIPTSWINRKESFYYLSPEQALTFKVVDGIID